MPHHQLTFHSQAPGTPFRHYWKKVIASSGAHTALHASWREALRLLREATGMEEVRFHGMFHDRLGIYTEDKQGRAKYNFYLLDQIYDAILSLGMRPFVELGFMPEALRSTEKTVFFWKANISLPNDDAKYAELIRQTIRHLLERYGHEEVRQWKFEVWNEPNLGGFTLGGADHYFHLYRLTSLAIREVDSRLLVGGPATARCAWVGEMIDYCHREKLPLDFVTTHLYKQDYDFGQTAPWVEGNEEEKRFNTVPEAIRGTTASDFCRHAFATVRSQIDQSAMPHLPLYFTEFGCYWEMQKPERDDAHSAAFLCQSIFEGGPFLDGLAYWTFSDDFQEAGIEPAEFSGNFGLVTRGGVTKPAFHAYAMLNLLGEERIATDSDLPCYITRNKQGEIAVLLWNAREDGLPFDVAVRIEGVSCPFLVSHFRVDATHSNAYSRWKSLGAPPSPTPAQRLFLKQAMGLERMEPDRVIDGPCFEKTISMAPSSLSLLRLSPIPGSPALFPALSKIS